MLGERGAGPHRPVPVLPTEARWARRGFPASGSSAAQQKKPLLAGPAQGGSRRRPPLPGLGLPPPLGPRLPVSWCPLGGYLHLSPVHTSVPFVSGARGRARLAELGGGCLRAGDLGPSRSCHRVETQVSLHHSLILLFLDPATLGLTKGLL